MHEYNLSYYYIEYMINMEVMRFAECGLVYEEKESGRG